MTSISTPAVGRLAAELETPERREALAAGFPRARGGRPPERVRKRLGTACIRAKGCRLADASALALLADKLADE